MKNEVKRIDLFKVLVALITFGIIAVQVDIRYAMFLNVEGKVVHILWESSNHRLPEITIEKKTGERVLLSHYTIALTNSDIKVGDYLVKKRYSLLCLINGTTVKFSRPIQVFNQE